MRLSQYVSCYLTEMEASLLALMVLSDKKT